MPAVLMVPPELVDRDRQPRAVHVASTIQCVGISHHTASVSLRERLALAAGEVASILARFGCGTEARPQGVSELVILSTCNRLELYASGGPATNDALIALLEETTSVPSAELRRAMYHLTGADAVRHLCRTTAGLDSMVIGEPQILGQVAAAFAAAVAQQSAGHALSVLFRGAIRAGRRARAETGINRNPASVSSVAVKLINEQLPDLRQARIVVLGAGDVAQLAIAAFRHRDVQDICVVSRTAEHAAGVGARFAARVAPLERLEPELVAADVLVTATAAPHHVVSRDLINLVMTARPTRRLLIVDIAVPRDVDASVATLGGVQYWDLDDLERELRGSLAERNAEVPHAERVIDEEAERCLAELRQLDVQPLISDLRARADAIRQEVVARAFRDLPELTDAQRTSIHALSESLVNKLLHQPMVRLRSEAKQGQAAGYAIAVRHLFGLE